MLGLKRSEFIEIMGIVAVVVSLLFVAYEIRENTKLASAQALLELAQLMQGIQLQQTENESLRKNFLRWAKDGRSALSDEESRQVGSWIFATWNVYEAAYQFREKGILSEEDFRPWKEAMCIEYDHPVDAEYLQSVTNQFNPGMLKLLENECPK